MTFGQSRRLRPCGHRVHLGGIDEVDALTQGIVQLGMRVGLAVLLPESHGAQADRRDGQVAVAEKDCIHLEGWASSSVGMRRYLVLRSARRCSDASPVPFTVTGSDDTALRLPVMSTN